MYQLYVIDNSAFDPKKFVTESGDIENIRKRLDKEILKDKDVKYIIEQTTGHVDGLGNLVPSLVEEN